MNDAAEEGEMGNVLEEGDAVDMGGEELGDRDEEMPDAQ